MAKKVLVPIADGIEEIEAACIVDVLRRAQVVVTVASVGQLQISGSRGVKIVADCLISECANEIYDLIALPGGMPGAEHLRDSKTLKVMLAAQAQEGRYFAAICASPVVVLKHHGLLGQKRATCFPAMVNQLENQDMASERVVLDGLCVTSQGPATAIEFSLKLVELLCSGSKAQEISRAVVFS